MNHVHTSGAARRMWARDGIRWGLFGVVDTVLPPLEGAVAVELGAGTAFFSAALARAGATPIAIDLNEDQLGTAQTCQQEFGLDFPLMQADAHAVPLRAACADLVVSDHGASVWCDPAQWVREAARILRPGGMLVFVVNSPLATMCVGEAGPATTELHRAQTELGRMRFDGFEYHPTHGQWIEVLRRHGFEVLGLHELIATSDNQQSYYEIADLEWARQWPAEDLWVTRLI